MRKPLSDGLIMKLNYNSHILKLSAINWKRDCDRVVDALNTAHGRKIVIRVKQGDSEKREVDLEDKDLDVGLKNAEIDLNRHFDLELVIRTPLPETSVQKALLGEADYHDRGDYNTLQWAGDRSTGTIPSHPVRNSPMFFRDNGMNVDLIDLYRNAPVFLILNGPSFAKVNHDLLRQPGVLTFGINNGAHLFRPDFWTCVDNPTRFMKSIWADPKITKFVPMAHYRKPIWDAERKALSEELVAEFPNVIGFRRNEKFNAKQWLWEDTINWGNHGNLGGGRSVMLSALKICYLLGFRRIFLLGCDFRMDESNHYWFPEGRTSAAVRNNTSSYKIMQGYFEELRPYFEEAGFEVFNTVQDSGLKTFPYYPLEEAIGETVIDTSASTVGMYVDRRKEIRKLEKQVNSAPAPRDPKSGGIREHLLNALEHSQVDSAPFFHFTFRDCFPTQVYQQIHRHFPDSSQYEDLRHRDAMKSDGSSSRLHLILKPPSLDKLAPDVKEFWSLIYEALSSEELRQAFFAKHEPALRNRFGEDWRDIEVEPRVSLIQDLDGYQIQVHRDITKKVITTQFYLPLDQSQEHLGTSFYRRKNHSGKEKYQLDRRMKFLPNSGYSFTVSDKSYHGVDRLEEQDAPRHSLMLVYYLKE